MGELSVHLRVLPGLTPYAEALQLQRDTVDRLQNDACPDTLFIVEHPPVITLGVSAKEQGIVASSVDLDRLGIEVHQIERGGQATYHGPGQIVGYPVINLHHFRLGVARYIHQLEELMIRASAKLNVSAIRRQGLTGIFSAEGHQGKIGAIGVRVSRGVTFHGFALNVATNLSHYRLIVPCGLADTPVVSVESLTGEAPDMEQARESVITAFAEVFGVALNR